MWMAIKIPRRLIVVNLTDNIRTFRGEVLNVAPARFFHCVLRMKGLKHIQVCRSSVEKTSTSSVERSGLRLTAVEFY